MKILISTSYYLPNVSGITVYIKTLSQELVKRGYKVTILTSHHDFESKSRERTKGVEIKRLWAPIRIGKGLIMPFFPILIIKELINSDVINCHLPSLESFFVAFGKIILKKRLIVTYHCDFDSGNIVINKFINIIQSIVLKSANVVVVNTKDYIESYNLLKNYRKKIVEIYPPILVEKVSNKEKLEIDNKLINFKSKKIIGFLGRISKEKNLELLNKAISIIDKKINYGLVIAGPDKVIGENYYQNKIEKIFKKKNVLKIGMVKNVSAFLERCDCLVIPSNNRLESFGMVQVEAIKNGTPCVVGNLPGIRTVVLETKMGEIFESNDANDLARKITTVLIKGKDYYNNKSQNLESFDYKKLIDAYEKLFISISK